MLVDYAWALGSPRNVVDIPSATPLKKTHFPSPSNCSVSNSFLVMGRTSCPLPFHAGIFSGLILCTSSAWLYGLWVHMYVSPAGPGKRCFFGVIHQLLLSQSLCLPFRNFWAFKGEVWFHLGQILLVLLFWDVASWIPGWPWTHYVAEDDLLISDPPASTWWAEHPKASGMLSKPSTSCTPSTNCTLMVAFKESFLGASVGGPGEAWAQKIQNDSQGL